MKIKKILERINYTGPLKPSLEVLSALQHAWLFSVPFENLDIHANVKILLEPEHFYKKIIINGRGGFCYESNSLFYYLLQEIGFNVSIISAQMAIYSPPPPHYSHMALLVTIDQDYLADVSNGKSIHVPMIIPSTDITHAEGVSYKISSYNDEYALYFRLTNTNWKPRYIFSKTPRKLAEFSEACEYHQNSSESIFTKQRLCTLPTKSGRITFAGDTLSVEENGSEILKRKITSGKEAEIILIKYFNINYQIIDL